MNKLCVQFGLKQHNFSMYNAPANGLAEVFNKTLYNILKKVVNCLKKDWYDRIGEALCAYRTTFWTLTQVTPYSLIYGVEVVFLLECQIPSLRIVIQEGLSNEDNVHLHLEALWSFRWKASLGTTTIRMLSSMILQSFQQKDVTALIRRRRSCIGNTTPNNNVKTHGQ